MQPAASRRAFGFLASKIHPQLPLSPRESQQLLALLTTSFRAHLDREHPVAFAENGGVPRARRPGSKAARLQASPAGATSSHTSASQHIESILASPLFARPRRKASDPAKLDAQEVLRDPLGWFLDQVAAGAADLPKAAACLQMLERNLSDTQRGVPQTVGDGRRPASQLAAWLRSSGTDTSREFITFNSRSFPKLLVKWLLLEGQEAVLWQWFGRNPQQRVEETGLEENAIQLFRRRFLWAMVTNRAQTEPHIDEALVMFLRATQMLDTPEYGLTKDIIRPAGSQLVRHILTNPEPALSSELYESFLQSSKIWPVYSRSVQSLLWLHHPTKPSALPAIAYIRDPNGVTSDIPNATAKGRRQLVHLCLGAAHRLLAEQKFLDAQYVLEFSRENFPELVGPDSKQSTIDCGSVRNNVKRLREEENLAMLDRLLPT